MNEVKLQLLKDLLELDLLCKENLGGTERAEMLRDRMCGPFQGISEDDRKELQVWSALFDEFETYRAGKPMRREAKFVQADVGPEPEKLPPEEWQ